MSDCWYSDEDDYIDSDEDEHIARRLPLTSVASGSAGQRREGKNGDSPKASLGSSFGLGNGLAGKIGAALHDVSGSLKTQVRRRSDYFLCSLDEKCASKSMISLSRLDGAPLMTSALPK